MIANSVDIESVSKSVEVLLAEQQEEQAQAAALANQQQSLTQTAGGQEALQGVINEQ